jgi:hypothetical protein
LIRNILSTSEATNHLAHGIDLRNMTTTGDLDADIDAGELIETEKKDGLVELGPEDLSGEELEGSAVDLDEALALHAPRDGCKLGLSINFWASLRL